MNIFKRLTALLLVAIILVLSMNVFALAEERISETEVIGTYDFEIIADTDVNNSTVRASTSSIDDTFNVYLEHQGSTRSYSTSNLKYTITITDVNGNAANNILAVQLFNSNGTKILESQYWADGISYSLQNISISTSQSYYFKYVLAYGTARTLKVHMVITNY